MAPTLLVMVILGTALLSGGGVALYGWLKRRGDRLTVLESQVKKLSATVPAFEAVIADQGRGLGELEKAFVQQQTRNQPFVVPPKEDTPENVATNFQRQRQRAEQGAELLREGKGDVHVIG